MTGSGDMQNIVRKILWHQAMQALANKHGQLKTDLFLTLQPVTVSKYQCDVLKIKKVDISVHILQLITYLQQAFSLSILRVL